MQECVWCNEATESQSDDGLAVNCDILVGLPSLFKVHNPPPQKKREVGGVGGDCEKCARALRMTDGLGWAAASVCFLRAG